MSKPKLSVGALFAKGKTVATAETEAPPLPMPMPEVAMPDDQKTLIAEVAHKPRKEPRKAVEPTPTEAPPRSRGRPAKPAKANEIRTSFGLDPDTSKKLKLYLVEHGITLQEFIEDHVRSVLKR